MQFTRHVAEIVAWQEFILKQEGRVRDDAGVATRGTDPGARVRVREPRAALTADLSRERPQHSSSVGEGGTVLGRMVAQR